MLASLEEVEVFTTDEVVVTVVTHLVRMCFTRSTSVCVRVLYIAGFGKSFGQSAARWSWKKLRHLTQPLFSFKSLRSESSNFGHCSRGAEGAYVVGAAEALLLLGTWRDDGSLKLF